MTCILNGTLIQFHNESKEMYVCDCYAINDAFIFRFNGSAFDHPWPADMVPERRPDAVVDRNGELYVFDRIDDMGILVVAADNVVSFSDRLIKAFADYTITAAEHRYGAQT